MKICYLLALIGLAISFALPTFAQPTGGAATPTYTLTDVGTLNGYFGSQGAAINDTISQRELNIDIFTQKSCQRSCRASFSWLERIP
jgi:hypothetical protein